MEEQRKQIDVAEQDLQKRGKDLRNAEKALEEAEGGSRNGY